MYSGRHEAGVNRLSILRKIRLKDCEFFEGTGGVTFLWWMVLWEHTTSSQWDVIRYASLESNSSDLSELSQH